MRDLMEVMMKSLEERREINRNFVKKQLESNEKNNAKLIFEEAKEICGKYCDFYGCHGGYLLGATCGHDDYYWLYITTDLKIGYSSCVGNPDVVSDKPSSIKYNVLEEIVNNKPQTIIDKVKDSFTRCDDVMMTPLYIGGKEYILEV